MLFFDASIRIPVSKEEKQDFQHACKMARKLMSPVIRDLIAGYTKATRKAMVFPGNYEVPNHRELVETTVSKEGGALWMPKRQ